MFCSVPPVWKISLRSPWADSNSSCISGCDCWSRYPDVGLIAGPRAQSRVIRQRAITASAALMAISLWLLSIRSIPPRSIPTLSIGSMASGGVLSAGAGRQRRSLVARGRWLAVPRVGRGTDVHIGRRGHDGASDRLPLAQLVRRIHDQGVLIGDSLRDFQHLSVIASNRDWHIVNCVLRCDYGDACSLRIVDQSACRNSQRTLLAREIEMHPDVHTGENLCVAVIDVDFGQQGTRRDIERPGHASHRARK